MKIVFMGTPHFAVPVLKELIKHHDVRLVVTQPDKPNKRGKKVTFSPIKDVAINNNIEVYQPEKIKTEKTVEKLKQYDADVFIVVAYGQILSEEVLSIPKKGSINIHGSILPKYRGPSPIHYAVLNGDTETGVTIMYMDKGMDTGDIIKVAKMPILQSDTTGTVHDKMCILGANTLIEVLKNIENGIIYREKQNNEEATYCKLLKKDEGKINFNNCSEDIVNHVRGMTPYPGAYMLIGDKKYKVAKVSISKFISNEKAGTVIKGAEDGEILIKTLDYDSCIKIEMIQKPSGKMLNVNEFIKGNKFEKGLLID